MNCTELRPSDDRGVFESTAEPFNSERIRVAVETVTCEGASVICNTSGVPSWDKESASTPVLKKRLSAAEIALSSSGTTCPPSCHSVVMFSQCEGTLLSCAVLKIGSALPSTCNDGVAID
eukprot:scaffold116915_cov75-Phaeocystis_antarctica.AAC.2